MMGGVCDGPDHGSFSRSGLAPLGGAQRTAPGGNRNRTPIPYGGADSTDTLALQFEVSEPTGRVPSLAASRVATPSGRSDNRWRVPRQVC